MHEGLFKVERGEDPLGKYADAEEIFTDALKRNKMDGMVWTWRGAARAYCGRYRLSRKEDPGADFQAAEEFLGRALEIEKKLPLARMYRGMVLTWRGSLRAGRGEDPSSEFSAAEQDFARSLSMHQEGAEAWMERGHLRFEKAQHGESRKAAAEAEVGYAAAAADYRSALGINPRLEPKLKVRLEQAVAKSRK